MGLELATLHEVEITKETDVQFDRGFYINFKGNLLGIAASPEGPVFFCNSDSYLLREDNYEFLLRHKREESTFYFEWNGTQVLQICYYRMLGGGMDEGVDRNMHEFLFWLIKAVKRKKFESFYTVGEKGTIPINPASQEAKPVRLEVWVK
ncbi:hypothetical protein D3C73_693400 [compost metagenome]